jgi:hypothetical protein
VIMLTLLDNALIIAVFMSPFVTATVILVQQAKEKPHGR